MAVAWLADVSEVDRGKDPSQWMSESVFFDNALEHEQAADCSARGELIERVRAIDCAAREIGWISGVMSNQALTSSVAGSMRVVSSFLAKDHVRGLDSALRVEMTIGRYKTDRTVIHRIRFSNPSER